MPALEMRWLKTKLLMRSQRYTLLLTASGDDTTSFMAEILSLVIKRFAMCVRAHCDASAEVTITYGPAMFREFQRHIAILISLVQENDP